MFNVGLGFIAFGAMLYAMNAHYNLSRKNRITTTGKVIGYKVFPTDEIRTTNDIFIGRNFDWHRIMEFTNPRDGRTLQMYSNPGYRFPEKIGTLLDIDFDPGKTDPVKDFVWIHNGYAVTKVVGKVSVSVGLILFIILLFVPETSALHWVGLVVGFSIVFIAVLVKARPKPNQNS